MTLQIDIVSDIVCPWCYIGKRHLESALRQYRKAHSAAPEPVVHWHPFELNPQLPPEGVDRKTYVEQKFGGAQRASEGYARVNTAGQSAGIDFSFDLIARQPNTRDAHRLLRFIGGLGKQEPLVEALFQHFFLIHTDLSKRENLADIAAEVGLDRDEVEKYLASEADQQEVEDEERWAQQIGVQGVPFFVFNRRLAVSGAQGPQALLEAIEQALQEQPNSHVTAG